MSKLLTVRRLIWSWQIIEFGLTYWLIGRLGVSFGYQFLLTVIMMIGVRALFIGILTTFITLSFAKSRLTIGQFVRFWFSEFAAFCLLYFWFQAKPRRNLMLITEVKQNHVIFAHGFFCNDGFWFRLAPRLLKEGFSVSGVEMPMVFGSIDLFSMLLEKEVARCLNLNPESNITIIGFSMGGLACRGLPENIHKAINVITLYTPHRGTNLARVIGIMGADNGKQMTVGSSWLNDLNAKPNNFKHSVGIWSTHDTIVIPATGGEPPSHPLKLIGRGHLFAAIDTKLHRHVVRLLKHF